MTSVRQARRRVLAWQRYWRRYPGPVVYSWGADRARDRRASARAYVDWRNGWRIIRTNLPR